MSMTRNTMAEFLEASRILIENALADSSLSGTLAAFGYGPERLGEGRSLWEAAARLAKQTTNDHADKREASKDFERAWAVANAAYMKTLKVARVAFSDDTRAMTALKLLGPRKQSIAGWLDQADTFYAGLLGDRRFALGLSRFGYDGAKLDAEAALVGDLRKKSQAQAQGRGTAQSATVSRDAKFHELDAWVSDFRTICRVAFYENPQELEKLGVMVLNGPRRAAARKAAEKAASAG